jgi:putative ABC transport system permease protein
MNVPVARRFLWADRRRGLLTVAGVTAAMLLVLVLDAVFAGAVQKVTAYIRTSPGDVVISQAGVTTMHMSASTLDPALVARAATVPGVAWVAPIGFVSGALVQGPHGDHLSYVVGYNPHPGRGGPPALIAGRRATGPGEAVIDNLVTGELGVGLGDQVSVLGARLRVVGLTRGLTSITNTTVFVTRPQLAAMGRPDTAYLLIGATRTQLAAVDGTGELAERLSRALPGTTVQTRAGFARSEARIVADMSADLLRLMATLGLLIALAVVGLGLLSATLVRLRDYAVLKAIGAGSRHLAMIVLGQAVTVVAWALLAATGLALLLAAFLARVAPAVSLTVTPDDVARLAAEVLLIAGIAATAPLLRLARVDAASAFRENR